MIIFSTSHLDKMEKISQYRDGSKVYNVIDSALSIYSNLFQAFYEFKSKKFYKTVNSINKVYDKISLLALDYKNNSLCDDAKKYSLEDYYRIALKTYENASKNKNDLKPYSTPTRLFTKICKGDIIDKFEGWKRKYDNDNILKYIVRIKKKLSFLNNKLVHQFLDMDRNTFGIKITIDLPTDLNKNKLEFFVKGKRYINF